MKGMVPSLILVPSFVLSTEKVKGHINKYFERSRQALTSEAVDLDLCLLCTQCFEVSCYFPE